MSIAPFSVETEQLDGVKVVTVRGELDLDSAPKLEQEFRGVDAGTRLLVDLTDCEFIDSTGVALIVKTWQATDSAAGNGGTGGVVLCCPSDQVKRVLEVTGLQDSIRMFGDRQAGISALRPD